MVRPRGIVETRSVHGLAPVSCPLLRRREPRVGLRQIILFGEFPDSNVKKSACEAAGR